MKHIFTFLKIRKKVLFIEVERFFEKEEEVHISRKNSLLSAKHCPEKKVVCRSRKSLTAIE
jgi:hypothetical protein